MPSLQVKQAPYATLSQAENANSQPAMTRQSDYGLTVYTDYDTDSDTDTKTEHHMLSQHEFFSANSSRGCRLYSRLEVSVTECLRSQNTRFFATEHFCLETLFDRLCRPRRC